MKHSIYLLHDNSGRVFYIGRTQYSLKTRLHSHKAEARMRVVNKKKCDLIVKLKFEIGIVLIEEVDNITQAKERERHWVKFFSQFSRLYNVRPVIK